MIMPLNEYLVPKGVFEPRHPRPSFRATHARVASDVGSDVAPSSRSAARMSRRSWGGAGRADVSLT